jgi:hypothetical protein
VTPPFVQLMDGAVPESSGLATIGGRCLFRGLRVQLELFPSDRHEINGGSGQSITVS